MRQRLLGVVASGDGDDGDDDGDGGDDNNDGREMHL